MTEFHDADVLTTSRRLYENIRDWAHRGGVTLVGGWAIYEQVDPVVAQQSRDIDIIIHNKQTLMDFNNRLHQWNLQWRKKGRNTFNDCHLIDDEPKNIYVDVFKATNFDESLLGGPRVPKASMVKTPPTNEWLPSVAYLVRDKLSTLPLRNRDREEKQLKDFLDLHNLVFHNRAGTSARDLAEANQNGRGRALEHLEAAKQQDRTTRDGGYQNQLDRIETWLRD